MLLRKLYAQGYGSHDQLWRIEESWGRGKRGRRALLKFPQGAFVHFGEKTSLTQRLTETIAAPCLP